ncbi:Hypothetical predicted protein [Podarcis lilfordi]|uniref:Uncharacterized protein n=1 Tax=Podarcis lilfordi TaxID=74358 RepID=A0AA35K0V0_9SAUR|nr:Hypothetical predicted protein [Podarcis lilfordi]
MSAVQRRRKAYYQRRRQKRSRKILSRRRRLHSRRKKKARTRRIVRYARSQYQKRRQPMSRYFDRRMRANVLSAHKAKHTMCSQRSKAYSRKPSRMGRPRNKKHYTRTRSGLLHAKLKKRAAIKAKLKKALKKHARRTGTSALKKAQRKPRRTENDIFYSLANPSMPKAASPSEDRQTKKQSVRFTTPGNPKNKEMEQQEDLSTDNQSSQQTVTPKKRGRHAGTSVCKSR